MARSDGFCYISRAILSSVDLCVTQRNSAEPLVLVHDAGHTGVTGNWGWDRIIGMFFADWVGGLSLSWWCDVSLRCFVIPFVDVQQEPQHPSL
jgi:hypothetical protein